MCTAVLGILCVLVAWVCTHVPVGLRVDVRCPPGSDHSSPSLETELLIEPGTHYLDWPVCSSNPPASVS